MKISQLIDTKEDIEVFGISYDSRKTKKGDVFVAIKGFKTDGHEYAKTAQDRGAACVVCERDIPGLSIPCIRLKTLGLPWRKYRTGFIIIRRKK